MCSLSVPACLPACLPAACVCRTIREFEEAASLARHNGFTNMEGYYEEASSHNFIEHITTPTLMLVSQV